MPAPSEDNDPGWNSENIDNADCPRQDSTVDIEGM